MCPAEDPITEAREKDGPAILVAEDEVLLRLAVAEHLREAGFVVVEAANAQEARSVLLAGVHVDLVFSDINMPGDLDGVALAQWLASHRADIPVVLTSGQSQSFTTAQAAAPLVKAMIAKPYAYDALASHFRALIAQRAKLG